MGWACGTYEGIHAEFCPKNLNKGDHSSDLGVGGRIILK